VNEEPEPESDEVERELPQILLLRHLIYRTNNHIYFTCGMSVLTINMLQRLIEEINEEFKILNNISQLVQPLEPKPIYLHINSTGGDMLEAFKIFDFIRRNPIPIYTVCDGMSASAGSLMLLAGARRFITENSYVLIHQIRITSPNQLTFDQASDEHANSKESMRRMTEMYRKYTKLNKKQIESALKHDILWDSKTCIKYGIADEILQ